jgi:basic amino acid/polyamine antiporter, APA family
MLPKEQNDPRHVGTSRISCRLHLRVPNLWARKSIATLEAEAGERDVQALTTRNGVPLKRTLSAVNLVALGIGAIVGAGIFVLTGHAAAANAGPAITLSFALGAVACAFAGLCYAEMASTVPVAGSAYTYAYATMGEFIAWIIGWDLILEYALGATTVAIGWSGYAVSALRDIGIVVPNAYAGSPFAYDAASRAWHATGALINAPAMLVIAAISALLIIGIHESARVNSVIVVIKLSIVVIFIATGAWFVSMSNWVTSSNPAGDFIPPNLGPGRMAGAASCAALPWSSLPISASTRSPRPRRKPTIQNGTCRSAFSDRSLSAPFFMWRSDSS